MSRRQDVEIKIEDLSTLVADAIIGENHAEYGFLKVKDIFNSPVDCTKEGIFICGYAQSPKDIPECCTS
jgi:heterodisulfide reductase subunit A-like polyferredoxin